VEFAKNASSEGETMHCLTARLPAQIRVLAALVLGLLGSQAALAQPYKIQAGDILRIEVLEDPALNRSVLVTPDGRISVPIAGTLRASGQAVEAVQSSLTDRLASGFANPPNVFVSVERLAMPKPHIPRQPLAPRTISVFVMGEAAKPGMLTLPPRATVLQAFAMMGGFTKFAAQKRIQLRRTDKKSGVETNKPLNYLSIEAGSAQGRIMLMDGDVILVPQRRLFE